ncbi:F-box protein At5g49610-like [Nicotiana sylvestris]|uniref:F-box protein At5g07610-like n=1 Tax=Nicotiana sylvestris TaxID=4096 RepID=A0A1U7VVG3_NICSY|nr:PREDICTED: F-box protein At5g07610-like [Nicotiana sylvestris]
MKRLCRSSDKHVRRLSEDIIIEILHCLPSKSLARFESVCKQWRKYIADPSLVYSCRSQRRWKPSQMIGFFCQDRELSKCSDISFFFSLEKSSEVIDGILDESVKFLGRGVYIIASSNGFILVAEDLWYERVYYVYNPLTRQHVAVPVTKTSCIDRVAVGFLCKVDDPEKDVISFTIVRYKIWFGFRSSVTISR